MKNSLFILFCISTSYSQSYTPSDSKETHPSTKTIKIKSSVKLSETIKETSGLLFFDNQIWTHNDDSDATIYGLNTSGAIQKKITLKQIKNKDWEAISQDSLYIYIGNFGNNYRGNRNDLCIYRIEKKSFYDTTPIIDTIAFSYAKQTDFSVQKANTTNFDCEAFVILKDSIYLFTKEWSSRKTSIYSVPKTPGNYTAQHQETLNVKGLITDATVLPTKKGIVLCGYSKTLQPFVFLIDDYQNNAFWKGKKRKIKIKLPFHQIEGITTDDGKIFYLTNEATIKKPFINTSPQLHTIDLSSFLKSQNQK